MHKRLLIEHLIKLLNDQSEDVRIQAIIGLTRINESNRYLQIKEAIENVQNNDESEQVKEIAKSALDGHIKLHYK